mgnify:CR=1 FL=1
MAGKKKISVAGSTALLIFAASLIMFGPHARPPAKKVSLRTAPAENGVLSDENFPKDFPPSKFPDDFMWGVATSGYQAARPKSVLSAEAPISLRTSSRNTASAPKWYGNTWNKLKKTCHWHGFLIFSDRCPIAANSRTDFPIPVCANNICTTSSRPASGTRM